MHEKDRMSFGGFVDKVFWLATISILGYAAGKVDSLNASVGELNVKMATVIERSSNQENRLNSFESRIQAIENKKRI